MKARVHGLFVQPSPRWWRELPYLSWQASRRPARSTAAAPLASCPKERQKGIYDAEISAEGDGLYTCTIVGEPTVRFVPYESYLGGYYRAAVDMACS